jgi:hypothetical protein
MKKNLIQIVLVVFCLATSLFAAEGKWAGWVTDEHCGAAGAKAGHKECALNCMKEGKKLVFYNNADKKIYTLDNQELAKNNLGQEVVVHGSLENGTIKVSKIDPAKK